MAAFLLSVGEALSRIENRSPFFSLVGVSGLGYFSSVSFFIYLALFSFLQLPVGVSGSVPEREHDHFFALCRRDFAPD